MRTTSPWLDVDGFALVLHFDPKIEKIHTANLFLNENFH